MTEKEVYDIFMRWFKDNCLNYREVFEKGKLIRSALEKAIVHAANEKWYGED